MGFRVKDGLFEIDGEYIIGTSAWKANALYHLNLDYEGQCITDEDYEFMEQQILNTQKDDGTIPF